LLVKTHLKKNEHPTLQSIADDLGALHPDQVPTTFIDFQVRLMAEVQTAMVKLLDAERLGAVILSKSSSRSYTDSNHNSNSYKGG